MKNRFDIENLIKINDTIANLEYEKQLFKWKRNRKV